MDNLFCPAHESSPPDKTAPSRLSHARRNISEIFWRTELRSLLAVSKLARRAMRSGRGRRVEWEKTFPVFTAKNPQVNRGVRIMRGSRNELVILLVVVLVVENTVNPRTRRRTTTSTKVVQAGNAFLRKYLG